MNRKKWLNIEFNRDLIVRYYDKSYSVKMPKKSSYAGYIVYLPIKMTKEESWGNECTVGANWEFTLYPKKNSPKPKIYLSGGDLYQELHLGSTWFPEHHIPELKEAVEIEVDDELLR